jgi:ribosomal protein S18 acetylase RimI-like enzyme
MFNNYIKLLLILLLNLIDGTQSKAQFEIKPFDQTADMQFLLDCCQSEKYWLNIKDFESSSWLDSVFPTYFEKDQIVIIWQENNPVGFCAYHLVNDTQGLISMICVAEKYRGNGYSTKLMQYAIDQLFQSSATSIAINVREENNIARALYKKFGFVERIFYIQEKIFQLFLYKTA